jgi:ABC1 atypical kinase-like domain
MLKIADPHPGNFMVTPEGKLVILDYGLMTEVYTIAWQYICSTVFSTPYTTVKYRDSIVITHSTYCILSCLLNNLQYCKLLYALVGCASVKIALVESSYQ